MTPISSVPANPKHVETTGNGYCARTLEWSLLTLFALLPFHAFLVTWAHTAWFGSDPNIPLWLSGWKEIAAAGAIGTVGLRLCSQRCRTTLRVGWIDVVVVLFCLNALIVSLAQGSPPRQLILGIRYDLVFLALLLCFRHVSLPNGFTRRLVNVFIATGIVVLLFGLAQKMLPPDFLMRFGYAAPSGWIGQDGVSSCQWLGGTRICRLQSVFGGPIRFASFLVLFSVPLWAVMRNEARRRSRRIGAGILLLLTLLALFWTYARSAWIAEAAVATAFCITGRWENVVKQHWKAWSVSLTGAMVILIVVMAWFPGILSGLARLESSRERWEGIQKSFEAIAIHPEGQGLGTAGPASLALPKEQVLLNENWYLQMFTETGVIGGTLFLVLCIVLFRATIRSNHPWHREAVVGCTAIAVMGLFTHVFEEASVAYFVMAMLGLVTREQGRPHSLPKSTPRLLSSTLGRTLP